MSTTAYRESLLDFAEEVLNSREWFDYHDWDNYIECEEDLEAGDGPDMTEDDLEWLRENCEVTVAVRRKKA